jgi:hypothetical protein
MPDFHTWLAWAIAALAFVLGAQAFGLAGLLILIVLALVAVTLVGASAGARARRALVRPDARFEATDEVFHDPTTGKITRVYVDHNTGERRYKRDS